MTTPLQELFQPHAMAATVRRFADQSEDRSFLSVYEAGEPIEAEKNGSFMWEELRFSRDLAPVTGMDSPSTSVKKTTRIPRSGTCIAIKEHVDLPARFLEGWNAPGQSVPNAAAVISNELLNLTNRVMKTKNYWAAKSLLTTSGAVDFSTFPNTQIAAGSATYPVQALTAGASWATAGTKIRSSEINTLKKTYRRGAGFRARRAIASSTIENNLTANTEIGTFIAGGSLAGAILGRSFEERGIGDVIDLGGIQWSFADDYYATDASPDSAVEVNADLTKFCVLPDASRDRECFALVEGWIPVPAGPIGSAVDVSGGPGLIRWVKGFAAYVVLTTNPVGLQLHVIWCGFLVQKVQKAVMVFDSVP